MSDHQKGDRVRIEVTFTNLEGALTDPDTVTFRLRKPDNTLSSHTWASGQVGRTSVGVFYYDVSYDEAGFYTYSFKATGAVQKATPDTIVEVGDSVFA
jgi:hypothetical protein